MAVLLGIDTGGTFTDAVLVSEDDDARDQRVIASAKSPTTHQDLARGIAGAVGAVLDDTPRVEPSDISLVSVSTTLATNALVEGHGEPVGLFAFGFSRTELDRAGLASVVDPEMLVVFEGGHDAHGSERAPLPETEIALAVDRLGPLVSAFAIVSQFSVRNPSHERFVGELVRSRTGRPVTSSHELSARLDGPRRALTAALNARLLGTIDRLNRAVVAVLDSRQIRAPLMVVRGDGSLVSSDFAAARPIETVLSGPAASVIGAQHLAGIDRGLVVDIGGTTTDIAVIAHGRPRVAETGAIVGGHRTMVEAVDMATAGLGGDSAVLIDNRHAAGPILLGPERAVPLGRAAVEHPGIIDELERQLSAPVGMAGHGRFLIATAPAGELVLDRREQQVLDRLADGPCTEVDAAPSGLQARAAARLRNRGLIRQVTFTPTDASALLHGVVGVVREASELAASILARKSSSTGAPIAPDGDAFAQAVIELLIRRSAAFAMQIALRSGGIDVALDDRLLHAALDRHVGAASVQLALSDPLVAIGAPAAAYYPSVSDLIGTGSVVPEHAEVANAVGAVVGRVRVRRSCTITQPSKGQFRVHLDDQRTFGSVENARAHAIGTLEPMALADAEQAGAALPEATETWHAVTAMVDGKDVFIEGTVTIEASGRPRF